VRYDKYISLNDGMDKVSPYYTNIGNPVQNRYKKNLGVLEFSERSARISMSVVHITAI
jgi:hypothetical protein